MATIVTETLRKDPEGISIAYHKSDKLLKKNTPTHTIKMDSRKRQSEQYFSKELEIKKQNKDLQRLDPNHFTDELNQTFKEKTLQRFFQKIGWDRIIPSGC